MNKDKKYMNLLIKLNIKKFFVSFYLLIYIDYVCLFSFCFYGIFNNCVVCIVLKFKFMLY